MKTLSLLVLCSVSSASYAVAGDPCSGTGTITYVSRSNPITVQINGGMTQPGGANVLVTSATPGVSSLAFVTGTPTQSMTWSGVQDAIGQCNATVPGSYANVSNGVTPPPQTRTYTPLDANQPTSVVWGNATGNYSINWLDSPTLLGASEGKLLASFDAASLPAENVNMVIPWSYPVSVISLPIEACGAKTTYRISHDPAYGVDHVVVNWGVLVPAVTIEVGVKTPTATKYRKVDTKADAHGVTAVTINNIADVDYFDLQIANMDTLNCPYYLPQVTIFGYKRD